MFLLSITKLCLVSSLVIRWQFMVVFICGDLLVEINSLVWHSSV